MAIKITVCLRYFNRDRNELGNITFNMEYKDRRVAVTSSYIRVHFVFNQR